MTELLLGTAQLGAGYGVTNAVGRIPDDEVTRLLTTALDSGVRTFDTAAVYDDAETRLHALMPTHAGIAYVTKFELAAAEQPTAENLYARSLGALGVPVLHGVLARGIENLEPQRVASAVAILEDAKSAGVIERYGASVYDGDELRRAAELMPGLGIVQVPGSIADHRLLGDPLLAELRAAGVEVHVRSAFLQGLLLADPAGLEPRFGALAPVLRLAGPRSGTGGHRQDRDAARCRAIRPAGRRSRRRSHIRSRVRRDRRGLAGVVGHAGGRGAGDAGGARRSAPLGQPALTTRPSSRRRPRGWCR